MKSIQINGTARAEFGKKFAKAARREGQRSEEHTV